MGKKTTRNQSLHINNKKLHNNFKSGGKSNSSTNPDRQVKGNTDGQQNSLRTKATIKRLKLYNQKMPDKYDNSHLEKKCMKDPLSQLVSTQIENFLVM